MKPEEARREKLRKIRELGHDPWGQRFDGHQAIGAIRSREADAEETYSADETVIVVESAGDHLITEMFPGATEIT